MQGPTLADIATNVSLQVHFSSPPGYSLQNRLAILLHPWSWLGGNMNDPVLASLVSGLHGQSYHVLRFNSRGVGRSTGRASFSGLDEGRDLQALTEWGIQTVGSVTSVVIIGYSHGSLVATLHPPIAGANEIPVSHIIISYPLSPLPLLTLFHSSTYSSKMKSLIEDARSKVLIVYGDQDDFTGYSKYKVWVRPWEEASTEGRLQVSVVCGGTHFYRGKDGETLTDLVQQWLAQM